MPLRASQGCWPFERVHQETSMLLMALTEEFHLEPLLLLYVFPLKLHWISFCSEVSFEFPHCFSTVRAGRLGARNRLASKPSNCLGPLPPNFLDCLSLSHFPTPNQKQPLIPAGLRPWNRVWVILGTQPCYGCRDAHLYVGHASYSSFS